VYALFEKETFKKCHKSEKLFCGIDKRRKSLRNFKNVICKNLIINCENRNFLIINKELCAIERLAEPWKLIECGQVAKSSVKLDDALFLVELGRKSFYDSVSKGF
jgi:hypothetical protein